MTHHGNLDETILVLDHHAAAAAMSADMKGEEKIKRPMNAFMLWSKQRRREISKTDPTIHNAQISKLLGEEWKVLPVEQKQPFLKESQKLMVKHKREHPNYRYKPRKSKQERGSGVRAFVSKPYDILPSQTKPYVKYTSPGKHNDMVLDEEPPHLPLPPPPSVMTGNKHQPFMYYRAYRECRIPGCYDCEYQRPSYRHHSMLSPPPPSYYCRDEAAKYESNYIKKHHHQSHCHCCSPSTLPPPPLPYISYRNSPPSPTSHAASKKRSSSFTVESLMKQHNTTYNDHRYRHHDSRPYTHARPLSTSSSPASPASLRDGYSTLGFDHHDDSGDQPIVVLPVAYGDSDTSSGKDTTNDNTDSYKNSPTTAGSGGSGQNSPTSSHSSLFSHDLQKEKVDDDDDFVN